MTANDSRATSTLHRLLAWDAAWELLVGIACFIAPFVAKPLFGLDLVGWWPAFFLLGLGCVAFSALFARGARGIDSLRICTAGAIANALAAGSLMMVVSLVGALNNAAQITLLLLALVCAGFSFLQWRQLS